jgi:hypothetical protein
MRKLALALVLSLAVGGCAGITKQIQTVENAVGVVAKVKVKSKTAYIAINVFNAAERSATNYLRLPPCTGAGNLCRAAGAAEAIDAPFNAGIKARDDLRAFMRANPGTLADAGLYDSLVAATTSLQNIMAIYGIGSK